jgi:hypothetical protein
MLFTGVNLELAVLGLAEAGLRKHAVNSALNQKDGAALTDDAWGFHLLAADVAGETGVNLGVFFRAGENHLIGIDHDDEIAGINVVGENWFVLATEEAGSLHGDLAQDLALGVDHIPLALDFVRLGGKRLHVLVIKWLRTLGVREGGRKLGSRFRGVNREISGILI